MTIAVSYHSRGGNTKKVAEAIAKAAGTSAKDCSFGLAEPVDLLFLGSSVYAFGLDENTKSFISALNPAHVKHVALFGTSAAVKTGNAEMAKLLKAKGIPVLDSSFYCSGEFAFVHKGHPDEADLKKASAFAAEIIKSIGEN